MYEHLRQEISVVIAQKRPDCVLFSGGIDSSVIAYEASLVNSDFRAITIGVEGFQNSDVEYSLATARELKLKNHAIMNVTQGIVLSTVPEAIRILHSFNPQWISSTITLLLSVGTNPAEIYATGEGSDDMFGSFPFFLSWKHPKVPLAQAIEMRLSDISVMSKRIFEAKGVPYLLPYYSENVKKAILDIPIEERIYKTPAYSSKYPLRKAYEDVLPSICLTRPQTMAFSGSGVYRTLLNEAGRISDSEFQAALTRYFPFSGKLEYYLFRHYRSIFPDERFGCVNTQTANLCVHCHMPMRIESVVCSKCYTFQLGTWEVKFD